MPMMYMWLLQEGCCDVPWEMEDDAQSADGIPD